MTAVPDGTSRTTKLPDLDTVRFGAPLGPLGPAVSVSPTTERPPGALVAAIARRLDDGPCYVSFSGGCDSSVVLWAAMQACRRTGHPDPIAVTFRYRSSHADEREYQEAVVAHLGVGDWERIELGDDADLLGDSARRWLTAHGPAFPALAIPRLDAWRQLPPGLVLSGEAGDEALGLRRASYPLAALRRVRHGRVPSRRLLTAAGTALLPATLRARAIRRGLPATAGHQWLERRLREAYYRRYADLQAGEPLDPRRWPAYYLRLPHIHEGHRSLAQLMAAAGHRWAAPLASRRFLGALTGTTRGRRYAGRTALLRDHFAGTVPDAVIDRRSKAYFNEDVFGERTREFAREWDGSGVPDGVDGEWLKDHWATAPVVVGTTALLVHVAWLGASGRPVTLAPGPVTGAR